MVEAKDIGLSETQLQELLLCFEAFPEIEEVLLFGSRALGNYKSGSDIDLALMGAQCSSDTIYDLLISLNQRFLYKFDVVHFETLQNQALATHIKEYGKVIYKRKT